MSEIATAPAIAAAPRGSRALIEPVEPAIEVSCCPFDDPYDSPARAIVDVPSGRPPNPRAVLDHCGGLTAMRVTRKDLQLDEFRRGTTAMSDITPAILQELCPTGRLRASINLGNSVLAQGTPDAPRGVSVDLANALAKRIGKPVDFICWPAAKPSFETVKDAKADIGFLAHEPARAAEVDFTAPYVEIEGAYMVRKDSALKSIDEVDRPGTRICVGPGSAYDLYLTRTLKNAQLVRSAIGGGSANIEMFLKDNLEVCANVRQPLEAWAAKDPGVRLLPGRFMVIGQAMAMPKGRPAALAYVKAFLEEMKSSGFVADGLKRSGQSATVAPPG
jgi:polar amino acid transport system substrate-binding protein